MLAEDLACAACGVKNSIMKRCTRCRIVYYCGRDCQVAHWGQHKVQCTSVEPNAGEQQNRGGADENASSQNPLDNNPMYSGIRVSPDGGYESYAAGMKMGKDGFPVQKPRGPMAEGSRVMMCTACSGNGRTSTVCEGIVRQDYCSSCEGEGAVVIGATGQRVREDGEEGGGRGGGEAAILDAVGLD